MLSTHGGKSKEFEWEYNCNRDRLFIENEDGRIHMFDLPEIMEIIDWLVERLELKSQVWEWQYYLKDQKI